MALTSTVRKNTPRARLACASPLHVLAILYQRTGVSRSRKICTLDLTNRRLLCMANRNYYMRSSYIKLRAVIHDTKHQTRGSRFHGCSPGGDQTTAPHITRDRPRVVQRVVIPPVYFTVIKAPPSVSTTKYAQIKRHDVQCTEIEEHPTRFATENPTLQHCHAPWAYGKQWRHIALAEYRPN